MVSLWNRGLKANEAAKWAIWVVDTVLIRFDADAQAGTLFFGIVEQVRNNLNRCLLVGSLTFNLTA